MTTAHESTAPSGPRSARTGMLPLAALIAVVLFGAFLRFKSLGVRSLWHDEFSTWYVSRMPLADSLQWRPELTIPPLYQLTVRYLTEGRRPSEAALRTPAAVCGVLLIPAVWWLVRRDSGAATATALALLVACNALQIEYSQEARPYSMLVLGCTVSMIFWHKLTTRPSGSSVVGYVIATVLAVHAHYLTVLALAAQFGWWVVVTPKAKGRPGRFTPLVAMGVSGLLCMPIIAHVLTRRSALSQCLSWIEPPTFSGTTAVLARLGCGHAWTVALLLPALVVWLLAWIRHPLVSRWRTTEPLHAGLRDPVGLLIAWLICSWFGLLVISWVAHPAMVARYALPAGIPILAIPLIIAGRAARLAPLPIALIFAVASAPDWVTQTSEYEPGVRELVAYLNEHVDPAHDAVVLTIQNATYPDWDDMQRAGLLYHPIRGADLLELRLAPDGKTVLNDVLSDPRRLYLIVGWADLFPAIEAAGRHTEDIAYEGKSYSRLAFGTYRLICVAPIEKG